MGKDVKEVVNDKIFEEIFGSDMTENEKTFLLLYLESYNGAQSYRKAYNMDNITTSRVKACELLQRPHIRAAIKRARKIMSVGFDIDPTQYIEFLLKAANANIGDYVRVEEEEKPVLDKEGNPVLNMDTGEPITNKRSRVFLNNSKDLDMSLVSSIKQGKDGVTIQLVDKLSCWDKIKDFMEWQAEKDNKAKEDSRILDAITGRIDDTWTGDNVYSDLDEALKEDG
mgnify:FL=1|jgi:phage terminase small subunit|uniref:Terminase small subunit n=1 Tax=Myoviridae sp. ctqfO1 TaxID=2827710 RepID=A0A8S5T210_9CAUD|nr:MAG TPA: Terminase small subunit [Myoviridae sp. ctqfO1]